MPLILAIEPNKSQSQQIANLVKHHLKGAELVTAATAEGALTALGTRIPDLILTPALLPSRDEAALTDYLRELGAAASHIHTLAVPIIATAKTRVRDLGSGLLGRRKDKADADPSVGCEPSVFAEQIKVYLDRAAHERESSIEVLEAADSGQDQSEGNADDFSEIEWLPDAPAEVLDAPPAAPPPPAPSVPDPVCADAASSVPVIQPERPVLERTDKPQPRADSAATRAFEAEFGLPAATGAPALWRVTEVGIDALAPEPLPEAVAPSPAVIAEAAVPVVELSDREPPMPVAVHEPAVVVEEAPAARPPSKSPGAKAPKAKKHTPPPDDWAYFDPMQSPFKALVRRLDEIAGHAH